MNAEVGREGAASARARLFRSGEDAEVFAGLVAFSRAKDPELRRVAAWHLAGAAPFAEACGVPVRAALDGLLRDEDGEVRRLAGLVGEPAYEGAVPTKEVVSGEANVGGDCAVPYPGLPGVRVHVLVRRIDWREGPWEPTIHLWAEARTESGGVMGGAGGHHHPDMTPLHYLGMATDEAQYGFEMYFRVLDGRTVRWWLRGLLKAAS